VFFWVWEPRTATPVVSFEALRQRNIWVSNVNGVFVGIGMFLIFIALVILAEYPYAPGFGLNEFQMGLVSIPASLSMLALGPLWGRWVAARGPKPVMVVGFGVMALGGLGMAVFNSSILELIAFSIPALAGNVAVLIAMSNIIVLSVPPDELGVQTGMNQTFRNLGSAVGPVVAASVTASFMTTTTVAALVQGHSIMVPVPTYLIEGFRIVFLITTAVAVVGLLLSLALRNYRFLADGRPAGPGEASPTRAGEPPAPSGPSA